jgi:hypothetical protein
MAISTFAFSTPPNWVKDTEFVAQTSDALCYYNFCYFFRLRSNIPGLHEGISALGRILRPLWVGPCGVESVRLGANVYFLNRIFKFLSLLYYISLGDKNTAGPVEVAKNWHVTTTSLRIRTRRDSLPPSLCKIKLLSSSYRTEDERWIDLVEDRPIFQLSPF